jgi:1-acyl-sn-glycerol-3-phosphate acyltransferase
MANYLLNAILVNRRSSSPLQIIDTLAQAIHDGSSLIFFPEGTRAQNGDIGSFKSGLYYLAQTEAELIPVYLENLSRILPKGEYLPVPIIGSARFGTPISLISDEKKHAFLERARTAILILKDDMT